MVKSLIDDVKVDTSLNIFVDYSNADAAANNQLPSLFLVGTAPPTSLREGLSLVVLG